MNVDDPTDPLVGERNAPPFWASWEFFSHFVWSGYTRLSLIPVGLFLVTAVLVAVGWWELVDLNQPFDGLLGFLWLFMIFLIAWRVELRRDAVLALVGMLGGFTIEWWGTSTELWTYFTRERPPLWIIPAWPVAALATERLAYALDRAVPVIAARWWWAVFAVTIAAFIVWMGRFMGPSWHITSSQVVMGIMLGVAVSGKTPRRDMVLFVAGTALGYGLEYWGTTRECWTYHTGETPPMVTALAHGFASVAFGRAAQVIHTLLSLVFELHSSRQAANHLTP